MDEKSLMEEILGIRSKKNRGETLLFEDESEKRSKSDKNIENEEEEKEKEKDNLKKENNKKEKTKKNKKKSHKFFKLNKNNEEKEISKKEKQIKKEKEAEELLEKAKKMLKIASDIKSKKRFFSPFIYASDTVEKIMTDVILALLPAILVSIFLCGIKSFLLILISVISTVLTEKIITAVFFKKEKDSIKDLSAVVTGIILSLTLPSFVPYYFAIFGGACAVIFGKILYGGLGKNLYNPAVVGKFFVLIFFEKIFLKFKLSNTNFQILNLKIFRNILDSPFTKFLDSLILSQSNSIGTFSGLALILGGIYLAIKKRISLFTPLSFFLLMSILSFFVPEISKIPIGEILLVGIFMATDMPTTPVFSIGKIYFGIMMALVTSIFLSQKIENEVLFYGIIILNSFTPLINRVLRPVAFGRNVKIEIIKQFLQLIVLTFLIIVATIILINLCNFRLFKYLIYIYGIIMVIFAFIFLKND